MINEQTKNPILYLKKGGKGGGSILKGLQKSNWLSLVVLFMFCGQQINRIRVFLIISFLDLKANGLKELPFFEIL